MTPTTSSDFARRARWGLFVLTLINLLNYLDRFIVPSLVESLAKDPTMRLSDAQSGSLMTGFVIVYMLTSPIFGALGDRYSRSRLIAMGVAIWSVATILGGFATGFVSLTLARATVGIGEAAYGSISPGIIADYFPLQKRGRMMAVFFVAIPVGSALGYMVGGAVEPHWGWRAAFFVAGAPGLLAAAFAFRILDPPMGAQEVSAARATNDASRHHGTFSLAEAYGALGRNRPYVLTVLGYAAYTFSIGGLAFWMPTFLERAHHLPKAQATVSFGAVVVVTGLVGTAVGGLVGDWLLRATPQAYLWLSGVSTALAIPFVYWSLTASQPATYWSAMVVAELFLFASTGPVNSAIVNAVDPHMRATAVAASILVMHMLGDVPSPPLIGALSDHLHRSGLAESLALGRALLVVPGSIALAGAIWIFAAASGGRASSHEKAPPPAPSASSF